MRERINIDFDWKFMLEDSDASMQPAFDDSSWRKVDLPHDWSIEGKPHPDNPAQAGGGFFPGGLGWYRKQLQVPEKLGNRKILIQFDGVYQNSEVWCNGNFCGFRHYGYSSFCYDITPYVEPGKTALIAVRVDNSRQKNCRWYSGSGIYRHVWLTLASKLRVDNWGTYITTENVTSEFANVICRTTVINDNHKNCEFSIKSILLDNDDNEIGTAETQAKIKALDKAYVETKIEVHNPELWSPENPALYNWKTIISTEDGVVDEFDTTCGIRHIRFDADKGFFLNGKSMKLMGVNEHHDAGCLGAAVPDDVIRRRLRILKDMGCNSIRMSHNPPSPTMLDLCDEYGFLVIDEAFDEWKDGKTPFGYQLHWDTNWERDLIDMIHRDRNHPSIIMWSVGNEIKEVREGRPEGLPIMKALRDVCHLEDPTRPMTCGCCSTRETLAAGYGPLMDTFGINGGGGGCFDYEKYHKKYPEMIMYASEVPHSLQTRGVYRTRTWYRDLARNPNVERLDVPHYTDEEIFTGFDEHYQSSYDNAMVRISSIDSWRLTKTLPYMCGEYRWTGFDYIGECYGWPAKSWNFGIIDLCGFPKDTYYFYQSQWTSEPMVHILPHWTWPGLEGKKIPVIAYSNCENVELFLNDKSLGVKEMDQDKMYLRWDVPYQAGKLKAVGCKDGSAVANFIHETSGKPAALKLKCDENTIRADGTGIAHVAITVEDEDGVFVPYANLNVNVKVDGPGELIGLENGDPIDSTNYKLNHRKTFNGMMLAIIKSTGKTGIIEILAEAKELKSGTCEVSAE